MKLNKRPESLIEPLSNKWTRQREFLEELGPLLVAEVVNRIEKTKSDPDGRRWKPWATSTAAARRRDGSAGSGLLLRTGRLRDSIEYEVQGPKVILRSRERYAEYLQNGTGRMPARPFMGTGKREREVINSLWKKWIKL